MPSKTPDKQPLVSIITVSYNAAATIEQTMESVFNQTYSPIEYILIDGGSTDGTVDIIRTYAEKLAFWVSEKDNGIYHAMNKGIAHATGQLVGIVNADDFYEPETVQTVVERYLQEPDPDNCCYYGMLRLWKDEKEYCVRQYHHNFVTETAIQHPTCFVPTALYQRLGTFDDSYRICADYDLLNRFNDNKITFSKIDCVLSNFRMGGATERFQAAVQLEPARVKLNHGLITQEEYRRIKQKLAFIRWKRALVSLFHKS
jgi:glycosyltransferase involved in cell wall biosynthesis